MISGPEPIVAYTDSLINPPLRRGNIMISVPTKLAETHPHPEEDAGLVPSIRHNLTGVTYCPNGFSQVVMTEYTLLLRCGLGPDGGHHISYLLLHMPDSTGHLLPHGLLLLRPALDGL